MTELLSALAPFHFAMGAGVAWAMNRFHDDRDSLGLFVGTIVAGPLSALRLLFAICDALGDEQDDE